MQGGGSKVGGELLLRAHQRDALPWRMIRRARAIAGFVCWLAKVADERIRASAGGWFAAEPPLTKQWLLKAGSGQLTSTSDRSLPLRRRRPQWKAPVWLEPFA